LSEPKTAIIVPIKSFERSKTRLGRYLDLEQRKSLCHHLVNDLIKNLSKLEQCQILLITNESINISDDIKDKSLIIREGKNIGVNNAVSLADSYVMRNKFDNSIVIPIDIPLLNASSIREIIEYSKKFDKGICIVPSYRYDGTNILLRKPHTIIETSYDNNSFFNHIKRTMEKSAVIKIFDYSALKADIDTIDDIILIFKKYILNGDGKIWNADPSTFMFKSLQNYDNAALTYLLNILKKNPDIWY
jgi:2-phospho-L-lactate/phosphoenolpyruvate guanylyltransferase